MFQRIRLNSPQLLLILVPLLLTVSWFRNGQFIATGEEGLWLWNPASALEIYRFPWIDVGLGTISPVYLPRLTVLAIAALFNSLFPSWFMEAIIFWLLMLAGSFGTYFLMGELLGNTDKRTRILASLFYLLNLYTMSQVFGRFISTGIFAWAYLPIFLYQWLKMLKSGEKKWFIAFFISSIVFSNAFGTVAFLIPLWISVLVLFLSLLRDKISWLKLIIRGGIGVIGWSLINLWWLYPNLILGKASFGEIAASNVSISSLKSVSQYFDTSQIVLLRQSFLFGKDAFLNWYNQGWVTLISISVFLFVVIGIFVSRQYKSWSYLLSIFLLGWFISKGTNPPFGQEIYTWLFNAIPLLQILRNSYEKVGILFLLPYSLFFGIGIGYITHLLSSNLKMIFSGIVTVVFMGILVWPMWSGNVFGAFDINTRISVPNYYNRLNSVLNRDAEDNRLLMFPLNPGDGVKYNWKGGSYQGEESSEFLLAKPVISKTLGNTYADKKYKDLYTDFIEGKQYNTLLDEMNIKYLIVNKDIDPKISGSISATQAQSILMDDPRLSFVGNFGQLSLYQYNSLNVGSLFMTTGNSRPQMSYIKINNIHYVVSIKNATEPYTLIFKETFNNLWQARIGSDVIKQHALVYDYANEWRINKIGSYRINIILKVWPWN